MTETFDKINETFQELDKMMTESISKRGNNWITFSLRVLQHIESYTVPQYGDAPNDEVESWSIEECLLAVKKYNARYGMNSRDDQQELDFLKMAHFVQIAADKYLQLANEKVELPKEDVCEWKATDHKNMIWNTNCNDVWVRQTTTMKSLNYCPICGKRLVLKFWMPSESE